MADYFLIPKISEKMNFFGLDLKRQTSNYVNVQNLFNMQMAF